MALTYGKIGKLSLKGGLKAQHNICFGHALFNQFIGNPPFGTIVLNPDFAISSVYRQAIL